MRYNKNVVNKTPDGKRYYKGKIYPDVPYLASDYYIITTIGDRLDTLADDYYGNSELWWIISVANNNITKGSIFPPPGIQLRIPIDANYVLQLFDELNSI
jgi:hypothetical protein